MTGFTIFMNVLYIFENTQKTVIEYLTMCIPTYGLLQGQKGNKLSEAGGKNNQFEILKL